MKIMGSLLAVIVAFWLYSGVSYGLTVDEIIKLRAAGVSDSTIELLIKRSGSARSAGIWKQDGWIVHSTPSRFTEPSACESYYTDYPIAVYPQVFGGRRHRWR
jgi:hypothetical protein